MNIDQTGFILFTINYEACVEFYREVLELPVLYEKDTLTCFDFHGSYLMVEVDDVTTLTESRLPPRDRYCLRLNVPDVKAACVSLDTHKVLYEYSEHDWGTVARFRDPDGNLIGVRSSAEHIADQNTSKEKE